jgi:uncharacterized protein YyaL (SSP411 family)/aryl-alcohol dehydrogenase-like predicted oxidoreductase
MATPTDQANAQNRLAKETSPYLLQHAGNPVDWYPWGPEALERAAREDKPILLSVGYSACHWCHVMERECFENPRIAALMNASFVCIKVDREERPDLDDVYMAATVAITGGGGWPMTVFCTPEQTPFFAGTYFPPQDYNGRPGFPTLLQRIATLWNDDRDALYRQAGELRDHLLRQTALEPAQSVAAQSIELATGHLARTFDAQWGGFGGAPKFPPYQALELLLRQYTRTQNPQLLEMVTGTLDAIHRGGIYDHLRGGFARYSTDERWLVPHFEKMLYDNAQFVRVYTAAFQVTKNQAYASVVQETLDYVMGDLQDPAGGYYSAQDADSEGEEGKYFVFTPRELRGALEAEEMRAFCAYYDITEAGNWEGKSIPNTPKSLAEVATELGLPSPELRDLLRVAKAKVLDLRKTRVAPATDDKILTAWNGLMIGAVAEAARVFTRPGYLASAIRAANYVWSTLRVDGKLLRTARRDKAHTAAVLEDYAYLADALIDLYEASGDAAWLARARELAEILRNDFLDVESATFFQTSHDHEPLIVRTRDGNDGALPNAGAVAARALARLSHHFDETRLRDVAVASVRAYGNAIARRPHAHLSTLLVVDELLVSPVQLYFGGIPDQNAALRAAASDVYLPSRTIAYAPTHAAATVNTPWKDVAASTASALYICRNYTCQLPTTDSSVVVSSLRAALDATYRERATFVALPAIAGFATAAGTERYLTRHDVTATSIRKLGYAAPVNVSRIGIGTQRVFEGVAEHQQALLLSLQSGCNLIDTAGVYGGGASERAIGNALSELLRRAELAREEVVLVTKVALGPTTPKLEVQLDQSLARLNVETVDVCLIHNPEALLETLSHEEAIRVLVAGFAALERAVAAGKVVRYGVSSHVLATADSALSVVELKQAAKAAGAAHFEIVQVPLNPEEGDAAEPRWLQLLTNLDLQMLTHRALDTVKNGEPRRLFDAPEDPASPAFGTSLEAVSSLEHEFRAQLGAVLAAVPNIDLKPQQLFTWSERIGAAQLQSREHWNEFERGPLAKEFTQVLGALDRAFAGKQIGQLWQSWRGRYTNALETLILAARQAASEATNRRNRAIRETLQQSAPDYLPKATLAQLAVDHASTQPLVVATLVGMRTPAHAKELTDLLHLG